MPIVPFLSSTAQLPKSIVYSCSIQFLLFTLESTPVRLSSSRPTELSSVTSLVLNPLFQLLAGFLTPLSLSLSPASILLANAISLTISIHLWSPSHGQSHHCLLSGFLHEPSVALLASTPALPVSKCYPPLKEILFIVLSFTSLLEPQLSERRDFFLSDSLSYPQYLGEHLTYSIHIYVDE